MPGYIFIISIILIAFIFELILEKTIGLRTKLQNIFKNTVFFLIAIIIVTVIVEFITNRLLRDTVFYEFSKAIIIGFIVFMFRGLKSKKEKE